MRRRPASPARPPFAVTPLEDRVTPVAGALDATFNGTGLAVLPFAFNLPSAVNPAAVVALPDGSSLVAGTTFFNTGDADFAVVKLRPNGTADTAYGPNGTGVSAASFDLGGTNADTVAAATLAPDGGVYVVGTADAGNGNTDFAVLKLLPNGLPDPAFGSEGRTTIAFDAGGAKADAAAAVAVDAAGRVLVAGSAQADLAGDFDYAVARLQGTGFLDASLDGDGRLLIPFDKGGVGNDRATGVAAGVGDAVVLVGTVDSGGGGTDVGLVRLTPGGLLDPTFGTNGLSVFGFDAGGSNRDTAAGLVVYDDGSQVVAGSAERGTAGDFDFFVARVSNAGVLDTTFGTNGAGSASFDLGGANADEASAVAVDAEGRLVVAGTVTVDAANDTDFGFARFLSDGTLDTTFGTNGLATAAFDVGGTNRDRGTAAAVDPSGRVLAAGPVSLENGFGYGVARLLADPTAGGGGFANGDLGPAARYASGALLAGGLADGSVAGLTPNLQGDYESLGTFAPFPGYAGPVRTAAADVNGDGTADAVYGQGPGGTLLRIVDGRTGADLLPATATYESTFTGGIFVAAADLDGDGRAEVAVSPDVGGGARVQVFSVVNGVLSQRDNFFGIADPDFRGGARLAAGDVNGDGRGDLVVGAGFGGGPRVAVFDGRFLLANAPSPQRLFGDFFAFPGPDAVTLRNGVFVAAGDLTGDGRAELIFGGGPGGAPRVLVLNGALLATGDVAAAQVAPAANFFVNGDVVSRGGVRVAVKNTSLTPDGASIGRVPVDLVVGSGEGLPGEVRVYLGAGFPVANGVEPPLDQRFNPFGGTGAVADGVYVG